MPSCSTSRCRESDPPAHDELLFITIHQVYELWFKLLLHELATPGTGCWPARTTLPRLRLQRAHAVERVLVEQVDVIETMTPQDFLAFRATLAPASGFQSVQFREIEFLSGLKDPAYVAGCTALTARSGTGCERRLAEPTLWDGVPRAAGQGRLRRGHEDVRRRRCSRSPGTASAYGPLWDLAEALVDARLDVGAWRSRHVLMVERQIGTKSGTGGSTGAPYLRGRIGLRFYPELWDLRSAL